MKDKVLFALNVRVAEEKLKADLSQDFDFVGSVTYKKLIEPKVKELDPNILILKEDLTGEESTFNLIRRIRIQYPRVRIIFISSKLKKGDQELSNIVSLGVYDIILGESFPKSKLVGLIYRPQSLSDVASYLNSDGYRQKEDEPLFIEKVVEVSVPVEVERIVEVEKIVEVEVERTVEVEKIVEVEVEKRVEVQVPVQFTSESPSNELALPAAVQKGSNRIISIIGATSGVGTTQIALNTAVDLARRGKKVLFVELNRQFSTVDFSMHLGTFERGIDQGIELLKNNVPDYHLQKEIIKISEVKKWEELSPLSKVYNQLPDGLDFLFYSQEYQSTIEKPAIDTSYMKSLLFTLYLQGQYDYLVIDHENYGQVDDGIKDVLAISTNVMVVFNQDVAQIGQISRIEDKLEEAFNYKEKVSYILNKFEDKTMSVNEIEDWLSVKIEFVLPYIQRDLVHASYIGLPYLLSKKKPAYAEFFESLLHKIY